MPPSCWGRLPAVPRLGEIRPVVGGFRRRSREPAARADAPRSGQAAVGGVALPRPAGAGCGPAGGGRNNRPTRFADSGVLLRILLCSTALALLSGRGRAADRLVTRSGSTLGEVVEITPGAIEFRPLGASGRPDRVSVDEIVSLTFADEPGRVAEARQLLKEGDLPAAAAVIDEVTPAQLETASAAVRAEHAFIKAAAAGRQAVARGDNLAAGIAAVEQFLERFSRTIHRYEMLELAGDLELAAGRPDAAIARYRELESGPPSLAIRAARRQAEALLAAGRAEAAMPVLAAAVMLPAADPASQRERFAAQLGQADCLIAVDRPAEAVPAIRELLAAAEVPTVDDRQLRRQLSRAYALLGRAALAEGREQDALIAYLTVDLVHAADAESHAESLFRLVELWTRGRYPKRAAEARRQLEVAYPQSSWAARLAAEGG